MRPSAPSAARLLVVFLAGAATAAAVAIGACADPDTQTPNCVPNVDSTGVHPVDKGCETFAYCDGGAAVCCVADDGTPLTGNDLATCRYGYADPGCAYLVTTTTDGTNFSYTCSATAPTSTSSSSSSSSTSSTSSSSTSSSSSSASSSSGAADGG